MTSTYLRLRVTGSELSLLAHVSGKLGFRAPDKRIPLDALTEIELEIPYEDVFEIGPKVDKIIDYCKGKEFQYYPVH